MSTVIFKVITRRKFQTHRIFTDPALKLSDGSAGTARPNQSPGLTTLD